MVRHTEIIKDMNNMSDNCKAALCGFINEVIKLKPISIYLFGGFGRGMARENWSDVDILLVFEEINSTVISKVSRIKNGSKCPIHLDVNILSEDEILKDQIISTKYNAKHSNAFAKNRNVSQVLYGREIEFINNFEDEKMASIFKINQSIYEFRKALVEEKFRNFGIDEIKSYIKKIFSTIRASMVIKGIYVHPYEDLVKKLIDIFPKYNVDILNELISIRNGDISLNEKPFPQLFIEMYDYLEEYILYFNNTIKKERRK